ncbi:hypothetical protein HDV00_004733 [Rhizophlyctis rosea]|nr:hypothetical protein HDV00_004733 [Rhizophlyctis rosea]
MEGQKPEQTLNRSMDTSRRPYTIGGLAGASQQGLYQRQQAITREPPHHPGKERDRPHLEQRSQTSRPQLVSQHAPSQNSTSRGQPISQPFNNYQADLYRFHSAATAVPSSHPRGATYVQQGTSHVNDAIRPAYAAPQQRSQYHPQPNIPQIPLYSVKAQYWNNRSEALARSEAVYAAPPTYVPSRNVMYADEEELGPEPGIALGSEEGLRELLGSITKENDEVGPQMDEHQPTDLLVQLMPHQLQGVKWMKEKDEKKSGGILADDMGLGKTVQTLGLIVSNKPSDRTYKSTLIVAPVALLHQWEAEIKTKTKKGLLRILIHHGPKRPKDPNILTQYDIVLTSYNVLSSEFPKQPAKKKKHDNHGDSSEEDVEVPKIAAKKGALFGVKWFRVILDEAQNIKNRSTRAATACFEIDADRRWCLTGTPVQNNIGELYSLFKFLKLKQFEEYADFKKHFIEPMSRGRMKLVTKRLQVVLAATTLRRTKTSKLNGKPLLDLPLRNVRLLRVPFTPRELAFYSSLESKMKTRLKSLLKDKQNTYANILCLLLRLRQACNHRYLVGDIGVEEDQLSADGDTAVDEMTELLDNLSVKVKQRTCTICLESIGSVTDKTICTDCSERLAEPATFIGTKKGKNTAMISWLMKQWESSAKIDKVPAKMISVLAEFRQAEPDAKIIIFSQFTSMLDIVELPLRAAGHQFCRWPSLTILPCSLRFYRWNPALEDQAIDRVHRIGQTRPVEVVRLTVEGTVEDRILQLQDKKREMINGALDEGAASALRNKKLTTEDLLRLFISGDEDDEILVAAKKNRLGT